MEQISYAHFSNVAEHHQAFTLHQGIMLYDVPSMVRIIGVTNPEAKEHITPFVDGMKLMVVTEEVLRLVKELLTELGIVDKKLKKRSKK